MIIQWYGQSFFKITAKNQKNEEVTVVIDPFDKSLGLKLPNKFGADLLLITHEGADANNIELIKGTPLSENPFEISGPGEYEVKGVMVYGIPAYRDDKEGREKGENTIYLMQIEEVWLAHLGALGQKNLINGQLEQLQGTDIILIPTGGEENLTAKDASQIITQIEPRIIIPMSYNLSGLKQKLDPLEKFIKEVGIKPTEEEGKTKIQKKTLPVEDTELIVIKP